MRPYLGMRNLGRHGLDALMMEEIFQSLSVALPSECTMIGSYRDAVMRVPESSQRMSKTVSTRLLKADPPPLVKRTRRARRNVKAAVSKSDTVAKGRTYSV